MINQITASSLGPISRFEGKHLQNINLLIGKNGTGKTYLLKTLYAVVKTIELYRRGQENRNEKEILSDKMYWTFQTLPLGNIVKKGQSNVFFQITSDKGEVFDCSFGSSTTKLIQTLTNTFSPRPNVNSIFIPAKEILSLREIIMDSRDRYAEFGYDDTYVDLAKALAPTTKGRNYTAFSEARQSLENLIGGKLEYDLDRKEWNFKKGKYKFNISITSEGIKKLSILDLLLGNHYLTNRSVIIIDEIEANLHPSMIEKFLQILVMLSKAGIQFFISTHSYFVIKNLYIMAHQNKIHIPTFSFEDNKITQSDLLKEMPENSIIDESINIYKRELNLD
ncbi:MAG: ATP-binding protein [Bacteroidaceae bacterium]|nr:ATP-binding protein [Bacteroidaceae bacterium]